MASRETTHDKPKAFTYRHTFTSRMEVSLWERVQAARRGHPAHPSVQDIIERGAALALAELEAVSQ